jgi:O-antigen/teichoic acid export membrane protein
MTSTTDKLTRGSRLARNSVLNLLGYCTPLVVAIFAIPLLIRGLGTDRFGVLALAWVLIGYLSLFDLGLSRALTKLVAEKLGVGQEQEIPALVWTALFVMFFLGLGVTVVVSLLLPWLVRDILNIPQELYTETLTAFYLLAIFVPIVIISVGFRGILDAHQRFDLTNAVRIPLGIYSFIAPLLVLPFSRSLFPVVGILVAGRLIACLVQLLLCFHVVPSLRKDIVLRRTMVGPLIRFGSWMTVTNIVSPLMVYLDRFFIGALISVAAVAYYATPHEVVTKLLLISGSVMGVLFPAFSTSFAQDHSRTKLLFGRGVKCIFLILFPITLLIVTMAHDGLRFWLGDEFAQNSTKVLQWIAVGVFIHSLGQVPYALIQGVGRPDLTAKLHLIELPFYLICLWWIIGINGIVGAAIAWVLRIAVDTLFMFVMAQRLLQIREGMMWRKLLLMGFVLLTFVLATVLTGLAVKVLFLLLMLLTYVPTIWFLILAQEERALIVNRFKTIQV